MRAYVSLVRLSILLGFARRERWRMRGRRRKTSRSKRRRRARQLSSTPPSSAGRRVHFLRRHRRRSSRPSNHRLSIGVEMPSALRSRVESPRPSRAGRRRRPRLRCAARTWGNEFGADDRYCTTDVAEGQIGNGAYRLDIKLTGRRAFSGTSRSLARGPPPTSASTARSTCRSVRRSSRPMRGLSSAGRTSDRHSSTRLARSAPIEVFVTAEHQEPGEDSGSVSPRHHPIPAHGCLRDGEHRRRDVQGVAHDGAARRRSPRAETARTLLLAARRDRSPRVRGSPSSRRIASREPRRAVAIGSPAS